MKTLIEILEKSVAKNGDMTTLTLGHLLNIVKMAQNLEVQRKEEKIKRMIQSFDDIDDSYGDRS